MTTFVHSTVTANEDAPYYWLATGDDLIVTSTGALFATDDAPVFLGSGNTVRVDGGIYADNGGSAIFEIPGDGGHLIQVGSSGVVQSRNEGILLTVGGSRIENEGEISAAKAVSAPSVDLVNGGLISGSLIGIEVSGAAASHIVNSGTIRGPVAIEAGPGADVVENAGLIMGDVNLDEGADRYDGRLGTLTTWVSGGAGRDTLLGGGLGDDLRGGDDKDRLLGGGGDDTLWGGKGSDAVTGGAGDDLLSGGSKADVFQFAAGFGHDVISDFAATGVRHDVLQFSRTVFENFAQVSAASDQVGADVVIRTAGGDDIVLRGVSVGDLDATDFGFVA